MEKSSNLRKNTLFINVFVVNIMAHLCIYTMNTLTSKYADYLGATSTVVGFVASAFAVTALIFKMISAPAIDTFNRKYVLIGSLSVIMMSFFGYTISDSVSMLIAARLLQGIGQAFTTTCCLTIASDALPHKKMGGGIGIFALGTALAQAIAPTFGLKLADIIGYNYTFLILTIIIFFCILYTATMRLEFTKTKKFKITLDGIIAKEAVLPAILIFLLSGVYCNISAFLVLYAETKGINSDIGYFFTIYAITLLFTRPFIGKMADKYGAAKVIIPSTCCFALAFFLISISSTLSMFLLAAFVSAFGYGGATPAIQAISMKSVPKERRGAASCTNYIGTDLGHFGSVVAGALVTRFGYSNMWRLMTIPIFVAMILVVVFRYEINHAGEKLRVE